MDSTRLWVPSGPSTNGGSSAPTSAQSNCSAWIASRQRPKTDDANRLAKAIEFFTVMCRHNTKNKNADDVNVITPFHSVAEPPVTLSAYMDRVDVQTSCGEEGVLIGMILVGRYCSATNTLPSTLSMHRLLLIATRIGVKAHHDIFRSNRTYARAGGLDLREVNDLELYMLTKLDYRVVVQHQELNRLRAQLTQASTATNETQIATFITLGIDPNASAVDLAAMTSPTQFASGTAASAARTLRSSASVRSANTPMRGAVGSPPTSAAFLHRASQSGPLSPAAAASQELDASGSGVGADSQSLRRMRSPPAAVNRSSNRSTSSVRPPVMAQSRN